MREEVLQYPGPLVGQSLIPRQPYPYPKAWTRSTLREEDVYHHIPEACLRELDGVVDALRRDPLPTLVLRPEMFSLDACRAFMARLKGALTDGPGCVILDRLPMERISRDEAVALYWLLGSMIASPVAQKWNGLMIYDVKDVGNKHGVGVRGSTTNAELNFHTDNSYAMMPPNFIGLLCLQTALEGGKSRLLSWRAVYNTLLERYPELLPRGFDRFLYDRNNEHASGAPKVMSKPPLAVRDDDIEVRFSMNAIADGYEMTGQSVDPDGLRLLEAMKEILADPELRIDLAFEPGQIQLINNRVIGHARTGFKDDLAPEKKRHLVRLWFRGEGRISYDG
jgi:alpha-ketoglutarate-dependent taurine dioxygenase